MTPTRTAAEAAATLTKAQRAALLWLHANGKRRKISEHHDVALYSMRDLGLIQQPAIWKAGVTPFGAEVRAILAAKEPSNADA